MSADRRRFSVTLTVVYVEAMDELVERGVYLDQQDAFRDAFRQLFRYHRIPPFFEPVEEPEKTERTED